MQEQESKAQQQTENIKQLQAKIKQQDAKIEALITLVEKLTTGAEATVADNSVTLSSATLEQNAPNPPVNHATRISYSIPKSATKAELQITDNSGKAIKRIALINHGKGQLNIDTTGLTAGTYSYTLLVDGKVVETKKMVVIE